MQKLETMLDDWLVKKAPFQIPENGRKGLVSAMPWITLIGGILSLFAAWGLWAAATIVSTSLSYYSYYAPQAAAVTPVIWVSLILILVEAVVFFVAFPALRAHKKSGWNMLFWVSLLNIVYTIVNLFVNQSIFSFIMSLAGSVIGLYLLFQIRSHYTGAASATVKPAATPSVKK